MLNGGADSHAITARKPMKDGILPLLCAFAVEHAGHDRRDNDGKYECAHEGETDSPCHGLEEAPFNSLQCEDGQVRSDNDAASKEDRTQDFVGGFANLLSRCARVVGMRKMADDVLDHDDRAIDHHAEVQCAERKQIGGNMVEVEADGGKQQRERDGERNDDRPSHVAQEDEENDGDEDDAFGEIVLDGLNRVFHKHGAIKEGNNLHSLGQNAIVELVDLLVNALQNRV